MISMKIMIELERIGEPISNLLPYFSNLDFEELFEYIVLDMNGLRNMVTDYLEGCKDLDYSELRHTIGYIVKQSRHNNHSGNVITDICGNIGKIIEELAYAVVLYGDWLNYEYFLHRVYVCELQNYDFIRVTLTDSELTNRQYDYDARRLHKTMLHILGMFGNNTTMYDERYPTIRRRKRGKSVDMSDLLEEWVDLK